jgi:hypothetical protein
MAELAGTYKDALKEFETLTNKKAATQKNKGKEEGIKKLSLLFKAGKTLDQRFADFDAAVNLSERGGDKVDPKKLMAAIEAAYGKLDEGLKKNIADYAGQEKVLGPDDKDLKTGCSVFVNRLESLRKNAKITLEGRKNALAARAGATAAPDAKLASDIKVAYLSIGKGVQETQALMKAFIAKPSEDKIEATFGSATGPRSIGAGVTMWKQMVLKKNPKLADKLGADPEHLLKLIFDMTQRKSIDFWKAQFKFTQPGWEDRAKAMAQACLSQMPNWATMAQRMKDASNA